MSFRTSLFGLCLIAGASFGAAMARTPPLTVHCTATGAKLVAPMSESAICRRFVDAYARARGAAVVASEDAPVDGLVVALSFEPKGFASAAVTVMRGGKPSAPVSFNLAVSDRRFAPEDVDRLAADTATGLHLGRSLAK